MASANVSEAERVRRALLRLSKVLREMTPIGAEPIPTPPMRFNLLARPHAQASCCRICGLIGHHSPNISNAAGCRTALLSLIHFWHDVAADVKFLYGASNKFNKAVAACKPRYEMRNEGTKPVPGDMETVLVDGVVRAWVRFLAFWGRVRAKAAVVLAEADIGVYEGVEERLNDFLLGGLTLSNLFENSLAPEKDEDEAMEDVVKDGPQEGQKDVLQDVMLE